MTDTAKPITETLSFKADSYMHDIGQALTAIGVLMDCLAERGDPDKSLISPVHTVLEDAGDHLRDLRELIEASPAKSNVVGPSDKIRHLVSDIETPIIEADHPDGILVMAGGDLQAGGNAAGSTPFYSGLLYASGQCQVNGNPVLTGHLLCHDSD